jgi:uncharacterized protein (DUF433 family)
MALRIAYWLRHPGDDDSDPDRPPTPMAMVREAFAEVERRGLPLWSGEGRSDTSAILVDHRGVVHIDDGGEVAEIGGQRVLDGTLLNLLAPFQTQKALGPDLLRPRPNLRIVPGKVAGEPHLHGSRVTTLTIAVLNQRGFRLEMIADLYPNEDPAAIAEAIDLESQLATAA